VAYGHCSLRGEGSELSESGCGFVGWRGLGMEGSDEIIDFVLRGCYPTVGVEVCGAVVLNFELDPEDLDCFYSFWGEL